MRWWQGRQGQTRLLIAGFGVLALTGMLLAGVFSQLLAGDQRVVVVTLQPGAGDAGRASLKDGCGALPGIGVVEDRGDPARQAALPVRFLIADSTPAQESALYACLNDYPEVVRGTNVENDGN